MPFDVGGERSAQIHKFLIVDALLMRDWEALGDALRQAMACGTAMASLAIESFSPQRLVETTPQEIEASQDHHRSPLVWACVQDWQAGIRLPLSALRHFG